MQKKQKIELKSLLEKSDLELEQTYGRAEALGGFLDILQIESYSVLLVQEESLHLINPGSLGIESIAKVIIEVRQRQLPLSALFLTTSHNFYTDNLNYYLELMDLMPKFFDFKILAHEKNSKLKVNAPLVVFSTNEEFLKIGGRRYFISHVPGHNLEADQIAIFDFTHKILFLGELLQPQGESYEFCTFVSPIPNLTFPETAFMSIQNLKSLPFEYSFCLNGNWLDRTRTYIWMEVTQKTIERIAFYARKVLWEEDSGDLIENAKKVILKVAMERNMSLDLIYKRMEDEESDFMTYDFGIISSYLKCFGMQDNG